MTAIWPVSASAVILIFAAFFGGRMSKPCPAVDTGGLDSARIRISLLRHRLALAEEKVDLMTRDLERERESRPTPEKQVDHAYRTLHVPVDSLASILLQRPEGDTAR